MTYPRMIDVMPPGAHGAAAIEHFDVSVEDSAVTHIRSVITGRPDAFVPPGRYAKLVVNKTLWMSDTPMEWRTNDRAIEKARGRVLIGGLGLGMIVTAMFAKATPPEHVTIVEKHPDVRALVGARLRRRYGKRVAIRAGDIFRWKVPAGAKYDVIYFDIWPDICADALPEMERLHARYRPHLTRGGWMESWKRRDLQRRGW